LDQLGRRALCADAALRAAGALAGGRGDRAQPDSPRSPRGLRRGARRTDRPPGDPRGGGTRLAARRARRARRSRRGGTLRPLRRPRPRRPGPLPPLRRARARLDVVRERKRRLGGDAARRPVAPDRPLPAAGRAADLPRPPAEPVHAPRHERAAARLRDRDASLPAQALPQLRRLARGPARLALRGHERRLPARAAPGRPRERNTLGLERLAGLLEERRRAGGPGAALRQLPANCPARARADDLVPPLPAPAQPVAVPARRAALRDPAGAGLERRRGLEREPGRGRPILAAAPAPARQCRPAARAAARAPALDRPLRPLAARRDGGRGTELPRRREAAAGLGREPAGHLVRATLREAAAPTA